MGPRGEMVWLLVHVGRWTTDDGVIECREAPALPAAPDRLVLLRRIRAVRVHLGDDGGG